MGLKRILTSSDSDSTTRHSSRSFFGDLDCGGSPKPREGRLTTSCLSSDPILELSAVIASRKAPPSDHPLQSDKWLLWSNCSCARLMRHSFQPRKRSTTPRDPATGPAGPPHTCAGSLQNFSRLPRCNFKQSKRTSADFQSLT